MVAKKVSIVWTKSAQLQLKRIFEHISLDSAKNALEVVSEIVDSIEKTTVNPEAYNLNKYKTDNDGTFRAFEIYKYRLSYRYSKGVIRVLRVRHTKMKPKPL